MPRWALVSIVVVIVVGALLYWLATRDREDRRRAALASIYAVTTPPCDRFPADGSRDSLPPICFRVHVMGLEDAARILGRDRGSVQGAIRWVLATKQLGARAKLGAETALEPGPVARAIALLGSTEVVTGVLRDMPDAPVEEKEDAITQQAQLLTDALASCSPSTPKPKVFTDYLGVTRLESVSTVPLLPSEAAPFADPQMWDTCAKDVFQRADYAGQESPPPPGTAWTGPLSEKYTVAMGSAELSWFENVLCVDVKLEIGQHYEVAYDLGKTIPGCEGKSLWSWATGETDPMAGGIGTDGGKSTLSQQGTSSSTFAIEKRVFLKPREHYDRKLLDFWSRKSFEIMGDAAPKVLCTCYLEEKP